MKNWQPAFILVLFCSTALFGRPLRLEVSAASAILVNADSGRVLFEKKATEAAFPASITKIATVLYVLEKHAGRLNGEAIATGTALRQISPGEKERVNFSPPYILESDGVSLGIQKGEMMPVADLLYGMMLASGNDAANVLAENMDSSLDAFIGNFNGFLRQIGCLNTTFYNPHGLHHPDHKTTAYDMSLIARRAMSLPFFREIVSSASYTCAKTNCHPPRELRQFNSLLRKGIHYYPNAIGIKTGFHARAKFTLVAAAEQSGRMLVAVLLGCESKEARYTDAKKLFEAAFDEQKVSRLLFRKNQVFEREVAGGKERLPATLHEDVSIEYYPAESVPVRAFLHWQENLAAPIAKGTHLGELQITTESGDILATADLFAKRNVGAKWDYRFFNFFKKLFK